MPDFESLKNTCKHNSDMLNRVVEDYLMRNLVSQGKIGHEAISRFKKYKHITSDIKEEGTNMLMMQFIMHRIFKRNGDIAGILNHIAVKRLPQQDGIFLQNLASYPWKFSFSIIYDSPADLLGPNVGRQGLHDNYFALPISLITYYSALTFGRKV